MLQGYHCRQLIGLTLPLRFYEKVIKVKADVAALHIFFCDIDDAASGGVENCQGRRFLAFISTLDPVPTTGHNRPREQSSDVFSELCSLVGTGLVLLNDLSPLCICIIFRWQL